MPVWEGDAFSGPFGVSSSITPQPQDSLNFSSSEGISFEANFDFPLTPDSQGSAVAVNPADPFNTSNAGWGLDFPSPSKAQVDSANTSNTGWGSAPVVATPSASATEAGLGDGFEGVYSIITKVPNENEEVQAVPDAFLDSSVVQVQDPPSGNTAGGDFNWEASNLTFPLQTAPGIPASPPHANAEGAWGSSPTPTALTTVVQSKSGPVCSTTSAEASDDQPAFSDNNPFGSEQAAAPSIPGHGGCLTEPSGASMLVGWGDISTNNPFPAAETGKQSPEINGFDNDWDSDFGKEETHSIGKSSQAITPNWGGAHGKEEPSSNAQSSTNTQSFAANWGDAFAKDEEHSALNNAPGKNDTNWESAISNPQTRSSVLSSQAFGENTAPQSQVLDTSWGNAAPNNVPSSQLFDTNWGDTAPNPQTTRDTPSSQSFDANWGDAFGSGETATSTQDRSVTPSQGFDASWGDAFGKEEPAQAKADAPSSQAFSTDWRDAFGNNQPTTPTTETAVLSPPSQMFADSSWPEPKQQSTPVTSGQTGFAALESPFQTEEMPKTATKQGFAGDLLAASDPKPSTTAGGDGDWSALSDLDSQLRSMDSQPKSVGSQLKSDTVELPALMSPSQPAVTSSLLPPPQAGTKRQRPKPPPSFTDGKSLVIASSKLNAGATPQDSFSANFSDMSLGESSLAQMSNPLYKSDVTTNDFGQPSFNNAKPQKQEQFGFQHQGANFGSAQQQFGEPQQPFGLQQSQGAPKQPFGSQGLLQQPFRSQQPPQQPFGPNVAPPPQAQFSSQGTPQQQFTQQNQPFVPQGMQQQQQFGGPQQHQQQFGVAQQNFGAQGAYPQQGLPLTARAPSPQPFAPQPNQFGPGQQTFPSQVPPPEQGFYGQQQHGFGPGVTMNNQGAPFIPGPQQQNVPHQPPVPKLSLAPGAFADLLPLALNQKVKEDDTAVKSLTEARSEAKKFEKESVPTLNDLKTIKGGPPPKPPTGGNLLSFD
jgi:hypothetical protein